MSPKHFHQYANAVYNKNLFLDNQGTTPMTALESQEYERLTHAVKNKTRITVYNLIVEDAHLSTLHSHAEAKSELKKFRKHGMKCYIQKRSKLVIQ